MAHACNEGEITLAENMCSSFVKASGAIDKNADSHTGIPVRMMWKTLSSELHLSSLR